jgi:hypothetical protein
MLALENKATVVNGVNDTRVFVKAQPFGGAIRLLNLNGLLNHAGAFNFDSQRSRSEQDFRIFIRPSNWEAVRDYCLHNLIHEGGSDLETDPSRELVEEFKDTLGIRLKPDHYNIKAIRVVVENVAAPMANRYNAGNPTARIYKIFEVQLLDAALRQSMLINQQTYPSRVLRRLALDQAQNGGRGRANGIMVAPLEEIRSAYLTISPEMRGKQLVFRNTLMAGNVAVILDGVHVPKYHTSL